MMMLAAASAFANKDWKGKVVDSNGEPVAYANVAVLSQADSTVLCGAVTEEDGTFNIVTPEKGGIMMVAMVGYKTIYISPKEDVVIMLTEDTSVLQSAVASAIMPKTRLTGEGLQTSVRGSVLENAGNAYNVLEKTPGIIKGQDGLEVIGKGAPLVYINGRKVSDSTELERLQSNEIQSVEVISNPGAQYDATVRAVIRIRTIRRQGDGFGFNLNASDAQSLRWAKGNDQFGAVNVNYRTGGVDFFGGINYSGDTYHQISDAETASYSLKAGGISVFENKGTVDAQYFGKTLYGNGGANWQIADNHFMGGKVEWGRHLQSDSRTEVISDVIEDGIVTDHLTTVSNDRMGSFPMYNIGGNLYYNGQFENGLGVDVNLDYYGTGSSSTADSDERSDNYADANPSSVSRNASSMYAAKAVVSYPVWTGQLQVGTEETFSRHSDKYSITGVSIPASSAKVKEDNYAAFASYGFMLPKVGMFNAGVRYEYVHYSFVDELDHSQDIARNYGQLFPTLSYAGAAGPVQMMLNYSAKTRRPNYSYLSSVIGYNSRYIWQSGNAKLQPEITHDVSLTAVWQFISFIANYSRTDNAMMTWSSPYEDAPYDGVVLVKPVNINTPHRNLSMYVSLTPTIGIWTLNYTFGVQPQWLSIEVKDPRTASGTRVTSFNDKPICFAQLFNTFRVKGGWQFELGGMAMTPGYNQNVFITSPFVDIRLAIQKTLLDDGSLVLRLEGADLAGMAHFNVDTDFGSHTISQTNDMDHQRIKFSVRYNFNTAQSKYRGTGAGSDSKGRM